MKELNFGSDIKDLVAALEKDRENSKKSIKSPVFEERQKPWGRFSDVLTMLTRILRIPNLVTKFPEYLRLNGNSEGRGRDMQEIGRHQGECFNSVRIPVPQFQGDEIDIYYMPWTGGKEFRKTEDACVDWVWVWRRARCEEGNGKLDGRTVGKLQGSSGYRTGCSVYTG